MLSRQDGGLNPSGPGTRLRQLDQNPRPRGWRAAGVNREPNPVAVSQPISGLDRIDRRLDPGPAAEEPCLRDRERLTGSLAEALDARAGHDLFGSVLGGRVVCLAHVCDWEQGEYFARRGGAGQVQRRLTGMFMLGIGA